MRNIILPLLFLLLLLTGCANKGFVMPHMPQGGGQTGAGDVYYYPPPKPIEEPSLVGHSYQDSSGAATKVKIALLVPLSGKYEELGKNMVDAAQLAIFNLNEPNLVLMPFDTGDSSFGAVDATKKALLENVALILGPIFSSSAKAIAPIAAEQHVSVISFSNDNNLADSGAFALGFLPEQQTQRLADYALRHGIKEFAAIVPNDAFGATAARELREVAADYKGGALIRTEIYRTDNKASGGDFDQHVLSAYNAALNAKVSTSNNKNDEGEIHYPRGLLIPEAGQSLTQIVAGLEKHHFDPRANKVQLLGGSQWYKPEVLNMPLLDGAWFAAPPMERRQRFETSFKETYGYDAIRLASLAYDGVALAATLARLSDGKDFSREAIINPRGFVGVDGIFRFRSDGLTERGLAIYQISQGTFQVIDGSPQSFSDSVSKHRSSRPKDEDDHDDADGEKRKPKKNN